MPESEVKPPIPAPNSKIAPQLLECPYCNAKFPLTWRRYFRAPNSLIKCPQCQEKARFKKPWWTYCVVFLLMFLIVLPATGVLGWQPPGIIKAVIFVIMALVGFVVDQSLEVQYGVLVKQRTKRRNE